MKTTVDIPDDELKQLLQNTKAHTKKEAIVHAIRSFNKRQKMVELTAVLGTFDNFISVEELTSMREDKI